jgi:hypothetical protein
MSESSSSAPAAPAATPAAAQPATPAPATNTNVVNAPAPASQESISLSDAGRLLARRRQEAAREAQGQPAARLNPVQQGPGEARATPQQPAQLTAPVESKPAAPAAPTDSYDTIAKALGLEQGTQPAAAPDGTAPAAETPADGVYTIDGHRVTAAQIRTAMGMAADYTRKTQDLAQQRQQLQQQAEALATVLPHIQPELAKLGQQLQGAAPPDPRMIDTDPQGYLRQFAAYQAATAEQQRLGTLTQLQQQAYERSMSQQVEAGNKMLSEKYEFWRDDASRSAVQRDIAKWAESKGGYTRQELQGVSDPRHVESMMKAMMFDRMVEGAKTTAPKPVQTAQVRGVRPPPAAAAQVQQAEQAFEARPNARNAAALLSARRSNANGSTRY